MTSKRGNPKYEFWQTRCNYSLVEAGNVVSPWKMQPQELFHKWLHNATLCQPESSEMWGVGYGGTSPSS